jgi:hypothetical protein
LKLQGLKEFFDKLWTSVMVAWDGKTLYVRALPREFL